uniref:WD repeat-containing protein 47 n=1 Tax=Schizaphis graminum TaxID=13262 RepID=A0A2S2NIG3_SCHGA
MPTAKISVREEDIIRLTLEFLHNRELHISQLSVERETGVINGSYSDDALFLRQLILDGQWDDVLEFIQPLEAIPTFPTNKFRYCILRHKYAELICMKSEATVVGSVDTAVEEVVKVLNELEKVCPTKEEYSNLCLMLTLPRLSDNLGYKDWNPSTARVQCFQQVYPLVMKFLPCDKKPVMPDAINDRLIQLIIKGMLYESCCNFCKSKAVGSTQPFGPNVLNFSHIFNGSESYQDTDLSLMSWLQSIPAETFIVPFEQKTLNVELEQLERPSLETSWTEHMLVTPIKPKQFPHSAMPFTRPRSAADIMSRSLLPNLDHTSSSSLISSIGVSNTPSNLVKSSFASFHLTGLKSNTPMTSSVDKLFESEVFVNSINGELPSITEVVTRANRLVRTLQCRRRRQRSTRRAHSSSVVAVPHDNIIFLLYYYLLNTQLTISPQIRRRCARTTIHVILLSVGRTSRGNMRHDNNNIYAAAAARVFVGANARAGNRAQYGRRLVGPPHHCGRLCFYNTIPIAARVREAERTFNSVRVTGTRARVWVSSVLFVVVCVRVRTRSAPTIRTLHNNNNISGAAFRVIRIYFHRIYRVYRRARKLRPPRLRSRGSRPCSTTLNSGTAAPATSPPRPKGRPWKRCISP